VEPDSEAIRRLEFEVSEARDRHLRLAAEFDNFRKRVMREREEMGGRAQAALAVRLLDVLDDLDRLVAGSAPNAANDATYQVDHTVGATFQAGYRFKGNLIRPARVQVLSSEGHA
jgi:molecular chaperone GrpE (heat shock protein)